MDQKELQHYVETVSLKCFKRPFVHQAVFNHRLRTTGGRYHLKDHHLDFNPLVLEQYGEAVFCGVVKHELCHYHLHLAGKGYRHRDQDFKKLLQAVDGLRYTPPLKQNNPKYWQYRCLTCGQLIVRQRRFNVNKYRCANCGGSLKLVKRLKHKL